jgi:class 3 adenylate cyclase/predicted ATPase
MDIAAWLRGLGLDQYAELFRNNDIDSEILCGMTAEDLKELGISSFGHRRRLLNAIAALGGEPPTRDVAQSARSAASAPTSLPTADAERRQLTVMFCDLVGSTALSTRFDPEDLREVIGAYHRAVAEIVAGFDGFVAKYMGDGVLVYFGYPQAHEDDAERAVRAGLALIDAIAGLELAEPLQVRIGIATGLVVVGDLIGEGAAQERGVVGETLNLAARLQGLAAPGTLVIAEATRRQIGGLFDLEDLGPQALAGFGEPQRAWLVLGESGVVSRFEALRSEETPLVGRDEEVELLIRRWQQAKNGEGRVVLISGEPGIGKSRLTAAVSEHIGAEPHTRLRYFCSPHHQDSALYPFIAQLERAAGFARDDTADARLGKFRTLLAPGARDDDDITLLSELLSLPNAAAELNLSPRRKREKLFEAMLDQFEAEARQRPVLMVFEDAHWIDPTSRELLDLTIDRARHLPVLLVVTFRPEFQHGWGGQQHVTVLALSRLGEHDVTALVRGLAGNAPLGNEVVEEIVERTDGVPLFIEELTKAVLERADQDNRVAAVLSASPLPALAVPATLHASLIARLDRIGVAAKEIAQIGAVLGREFSYELIERVAQRPEPELQAALGQLTGAGLLFYRGSPPHASYIFKHALVQDAAYGTLLRARRQELHARVAAVLETRFADLVERQPELLAHHLTGAAQNEHAVAQWLKAGQHAAARSAHLEAIGHFARGLGALSALPPAPECDRQEIGLQLARGSSLFAAKGFQSTEAADAYARAQVLCGAVGDADQLFVAEWGLWMNAHIRDLDESRRRSDRLLLLTQKSDRLELRLQAHHTAWSARIYRGEFASSRDHCEEGQRLYHPEQHRSHVLLYGGHDPGVCARMTGAWAQWFLGYPDKALSGSNDGVALAERFAHPLSLNTALQYRALVHLLRREPGEAVRAVQAADILATEQRLTPVFEPRILRGGALVGQREELRDAVALIREGLAARQELGSKILRVHNLGLLVEALERVGDDDGALEISLEALAEADKTGERFWQAEIYRLKGLALLSQRCLPESEASFERSLEVARVQQAKSLELRAAVSLARLWGEQGRRAEARDLLAPVYGWFTEGFDTADLKEAKALLEELG